MLSPKEVICKWVDAFNKHDVEEITSLYHENATNHQVANEPVVGIEAIRRWAMGNFRMDSPIRITRLRFFPCR